MLNFRQIDRRFVLSGGWVDVPKDAIWLREMDIKYVLDLQFTPDTYLLANEMFIREQLEKQGIGYHVTPMTDDDNNYHLGDIFDSTNALLQDWEEKIKDKRFEKILIKCGVGVSRSPAVLINHFCERYRLSFVESRDKLRRMDVQVAVVPISINPVFQLYLQSKFPDTTDHERIFKDLI